jgi:RNA polymerase sigma factor (sigma-70 family)
MATTNLSDFFRRLTRGMAAETLDDHSDRQLVERALAGRDEAAFQAIVQRHGPMVYRVCWRVLMHPQDAEDAFQAAFLVLAQKLRTVRKRASLASWLHGVARRVALKAKAQAAGRRRHEHEVSLPDTVPPDDLTWKELRSALDAELGRLPEKWRLPLILCYLEGRTQDEAASQLAWSKSTLRRRLEEARAALGRRLNGRGIVWPAALSAVLLSECIAPAAPGLVASTVEVAASVAAGKTVTTAASVKVAALTEGALKAMLITKLKTVTAVLLMLGTVTFTCGMLAFGMTSANGDGVEQPAAKADEKPKDGVGDQERTLTVTIKPQKNRIRASEPFKIDLRVVNSSKSPQSFRVMASSWFRHWKSSNERVLVSGWPGSEDEAREVTLAPGEADEKTLPMLILAGKSQEKESFKLGFTPIGSKQTFWSNEVTVEVDQDKKPVPPNRWEKLLLDKNLTAKQRTAYEQIAKLHSIKIDQGDWGSISIPSFVKGSKLPTDVLFAMGLDALPMLAEALDDETPTATVITLREGAFKQEKVWKVNEFAALLIVRIADRDFVIGEPQKELGIRDIAQRPKAAPEFRKLVVVWHGKFATMTPTERKVADVTDSWFRNRFDAVIWLGWTKAKDGRAPIVARVDEFYTDPKRESSSLTRTEMTHCALALGQIGDRASLPQVRRVCEDVSHTVYMAYRPLDQGRWGVGSSMNEDLFRAYLGLTLLGEKDEAVKELKRLLATYGAEMEASTRKDYEKRLKAAKGEAPDE